MLDVPLPVAIAALVHDHHILLIRRIKGSYVGLWALPGGKVEKNEHVSEAAVREILEETGIRSTFADHLGFVSEHLVENGTVLQHFLLHVCQLQADDRTLHKGDEGDLAWFSLRALTEKKAEIIPSDYQIIEKMVQKRANNYYNCVVEKVGEHHLLRKFEYKPLHEKLTVVISGSFQKHFDEICKLITEFERLGFQVLSPRISTITNPGEAFPLLETDDTSNIQILQRRHLGAIQQADALYICNPQGYAGASVTLELGWALALGKPIFTQEMFTDGTLKLFAQGAASPLQVQRLLREL